MSSIGGGYRARRTDSGAYAPLSQVGHGPRLEIGTVFRWNGRSWRTPKEFAWFGVGSGCQWGDIRPWSRAVMTRWDTRKHRGRKRLLVASGPGACGLSDR